MGEFSEKLKANLLGSIRAKETMLESPEQLAAFDRATALVVNAYKKGGRIYIAGNGGSAADAQHLAAEFVAKLARPRAPLPAEALTTCTSTLTAIGNDFGFDELFARQVVGKMSEDDVFLGITTSGQSRNIVRALEECRRLNIPSIVLSGRDGGVVKEMANVCVVAPGVVTSEIQEVHQVLYHTLCACVEDALFPA
jgi:D-sedoheptulose 7-phosphate isomerase